MEHLRHVWSQATPLDRQRGAQAYAVYQHLVGRIAAEHGFSLRTGAAVFSALSPNNDYHSNLRDTRRLLAAFVAGRRLEEVKVSTYHSNRRKAWAIAGGAEPLDLIVFPKTRSFFLNVYDPRDPVPVTVDGHIYNVWNGKRVRLSTAASKFRPSVYETIAEGIRQLAREEGLVPNQVQAGVWLAWRRMHAIKYSAQQELWNPEAWAAGFEVPFAQSLF